ncbi:unnamed protein product [Urochloa humidicola]
MEEVDREREEKSEEARSGIKCARCTKKGHIAARCTAEIYCVICNTHNDHMNHKCPVLKMPRPVAHAVGYAVHGLGFYHIPHPPLAKVKRESKTALIKVEGGSLTKEQVAAQLQRLFGGRWKWEVNELEEDVFTTKFPSRIELQRALAFGGADVKEEGVAVGVRMNFDLWQEKQEGYLLPKVWVRVYGMRPELREFLELWAIGSMLGSTQIVDMETTRKSDFGRIFIAALNPLLIPAKLDVVIGDHYFELEFEVEKVGIDENGEEATFEWVAKIPGEGNESDSSYGEPSASRGTKRLKSNSDYFEEQGKEEEDLDGFKRLVQNMTRAEFTKFLEEQARAILDVAVRRNLEEVADKVLAEEEQEDQSVQDMDTSGNGSKTELQRDKMEHGGLLEGKEKSGIGIREEAAIPEVNMVPHRSSPRLVNSGGEHIMAKTGRRAAQRNLELSGDLSGDVLDKNLGKTL